MALDTYTSLQASVADWIDRTDLTSKIPDFIRLAEAKFGRRLRTQQQQTEVSLPLTAGRATLPADFEELISVTLPENPPRAIQYVTESELARMNRDLVATGPAAGYTIRNGELVLVPGPGTVSTVDVVYFAAIPALSGSNPSNWLLARHPDAYLYGACLQAAPYLRDAEQLATWQAGLEMVLSEIEDADRRARYNGSPLRMRAAGFRG